MERGATGDLVHARQLLEENTALLDAYPPGFTWRFLNQLLDARLALRVGDLERADAQLSGLLSTLPQRQASRTLSGSLGQALVLRADLALRRGDRGQAREWLQRALAHTQAAAGAGATPADIERIRATLATFDRTGTIPSAD